MHSELSFIVGQPDTCMHSELSFIIGQPDICTQNCHLL